MSDHWPQSSSETDIRRPFLPQKTEVLRMSSSSNINKRSSSNKNKSSSEVEDDTVFDDSFVVRRKLPAPDGEDDDGDIHSHRSGGAGGSRSHKSSSSSRRGKKKEEIYSDESEEQDRSSGGGDDEDEDDDDDDDGASLAELTTSYGSGVDLHPHHKKRRNKPSSDYGRDRRGSNNSDDVEAKTGSRHRSKSKSGSGQQQRESSAREGGATSSSRRRKQHGHYDEEEFWNEGDGSASVNSHHNKHRGNPSTSRQPDRHSSRSHRDRHGGRSMRNRSPNGSSEGIMSRLSNIPVLGSAISIFEGINFKTILLCMVGMTLVMKLNSNPPSPNVNHGVSSANNGASMSGAGGDNNAGNTVEGSIVDFEPASDVTPGVRGAMLNESEDEDKKYEDEEESMDADNGNIIDEQNQNLNMYAPAAGGDDMGQQQQQPPPPPMDQPQQQFDPNQQQYLQQQQPGMMNQGGGMQQYDPNQQQMQQQQQQGYYNPQQQQQQGFDPQQQMQQQGYYQQPQQPQQQPYQQGGYANPGMPQQQQNFAVGQTSTYNQSPLEWQQQQQQMAAAQNPGGQMPGQLPPAMAGQVVPQQQPQFGSAVDASLMAPPQSIAVPDPAAAAAAAVPPAMPEAPPVPEVAAPPVPEVAPPAATDVVGADQVPLVPPPAPGAVEGSILHLLDNCANTWDDYDPNATPMFWHIPKAGGSSIKDAMGGCHRFVQATEFGVTDGHDSDTEVAIVFPAVPGVADTDRSPFVNIDSTTVAGIQRANELGFAEAHLAQVVVSPFVFETNDLFTQNAKGRLFSVFRHPIDRAVSMFYYIRVADWEPSYSPELKDWTLEQYGASDKVENNWMTRQLSNQLGGELTEDNLKKAMEVVQTKFLVGLMSQIEPTMSRFEKFFRWTYHVNPPNQEKCRERLMGGGANSNSANKKPVEEGGEAWNLLAQQNNFDLQLYAYIEQLFAEQEQFVSGLPDEFRNVDATCCKCYPKTFPPEGFTCPEAVKNDS